MADWRKVSLALAGADGRIDNTECKILQKELWKDKKIDKDEVEFLIELRNTAQKKNKKSKLNPNFEKLFFKAIEENVLKDGTIDATETQWLRKMLFADKKIDNNEKKFLAKVKKSAKKTSAEFDALYEECMKTKAKAKPKAKPRPKKTTTT